MKPTLLTKLTDLGPRVGDKEIQSAKIIEEFLTTSKIPYITQPFQVEIPFCTQATLTADNEQIQCIGSSQKSGPIPDSKYLISHFGYIGEKDPPYAIAYSPITDNICTAYYFNCPCVTISRKDIVKIVMADKVAGQVTVEKKPINSENILVGNTHNPKTITFAHYDSIIGEGAVDNAGSVITIFNTISQNPNLLTDNLFVFSGNEEMVYDKVHSCGYGFRIFEKDYEQQLQKASQIIVLDGIGISKPELTQRNLQWVFRVNILEQIKHKTYWMLNNQSLVMQYFHTHQDTKTLIQKKYVDQAEKLLISKLIQQ